MLRKQAVEKYTQEAKTSKFITSDLPSAPTQATQGELTTPPIIEANNQFQNKAESINSTKDIHLPCRHRANKIKLF